MARTLQTSAMAAGTLGVSRDPRRNPRDGARAPGTPMRRPWAAAVKPRAWQGIEAAAGYTMGPGRPSSGQEKSCQRSTGLCRKRDAHPITASRWRAASHSSWLFCSAARCLCGLGPGRHRTCVPTGWPSRLGTSRISPSKTWTPPSRSPNVSETMRSSFISGESWLSRFQG